MVSSYAIAIAALTIQTPSISTNLRERALRIASDVKLMAGFGASTPQIGRTHQSLRFAEIASYEMGETWIVMDTSNQSIINIRCNGRGSNPRTYVGNVRQDLQTICQREFLRMGGNGKVTIDEDTVMEIPVGSGDQTVYRATVHIWPAPGIRVLGGQSWDIDSLTSHPVSVDRFPQVELPQSLSPAISYNEAVQVLAQRYLDAHPSVQLERTYIQSLVLVNTRIDDCPIQPEPDSFRLAKSRNEGWLAYVVTFNVWRNGRIAGRVWGRMDAKNPSCMAVSGEGGTLGALKSPAKTRPKPWEKSESLTVSLGRIARKSAGVLLTVSAQSKKFVSDVRILVSNDSGAMWLANYNIRQNVLFWADGKTALQSVLPGQIKNSILKLIQLSK